MNGFIALFAWYTGWSQLVKPETDFGTFGALLCSILALVVTLWTRVTDKTQDNKEEFASQAARMAVIEDRIQTIWYAWLRRGLHEGLKEDLFTVNSPIKISAKGVQAFRFMAKDLRDFYQTLPVDLPDPDYQMLIEKQFGERIVFEVCRTEDVHNGACLHAALAVARMSEEAYNHLLL